MKLLTLVACLALALPAAAQNFTVTGTFQYEDKEWNFNGWTGVDPLLPIRRADVYVLNDATGVTIGSGSTAQDGTFSIVCNAAGPVNVRVRCDADTDLNGTFQRLRVTTEANVEYTVSSPVFAGHVPPAALNIGTVTALKILTGSAEANPFNMLDMGVSAAEYINGPLVAASPSGTVMRIYWPSGSGSFASGAGAHMADDDGYDDAVILHEVGHVVHDLYSDSDSPGGGHTFGDSDQDPLLSFGEGYATFFGSCVMESLVRDALYVDMNAASQNGAWQLRMRIETVSPYNTDSFGAADEGAVACTLFDIIDNEFSDDQSPGVDDDLMVSSIVVNGKNQHRAWWDVLVGPVNSASSVNMNHAWDGWFSTHAVDPQFTEMQDVFNDRRMKFWADASEPDNSIGTALAVPFVTSAAAWNAERWLYYSAANPPAPGTGDQDHHAVNLVIGSVVSFETRYPNGAADADTQCDALLELFNPAGALVLSDTDSGTGLNALINNFVVTQTGTWVYRVRTSSTIRRYGSYQTRCRMLTENHLPSIVSGPSAAPSTINDSQTTLLSVTASDVDAGQTLSYTWTPLDGGSIIGTGASVTFDPPVVAVSSVLSISLVVTDSLGAATAAVEVDVTVNPAGGVCGSPASVSAFGTGKPGALGVPVLSGVNLPVVPSANFALQTVNCFPGLLGYLVIGFSTINAPFDQGTLHPNINILIPVLANAGGQVLQPLFIPADPLYCGLTIYAQVLLMDDPGAAGDKQSAQSNGLSVTFGN
ncbi:MAG: hypothetical protein ACT4PU_09595 [Planctomycetota bacterium]